MKRLSDFSLTRWWAVVCKEFLQLRRDRITFAMIFGIPIVQMLLFGYAINFDPRNLPTVVVSGDHSEFTRSMIAAMRVSGYFDVKAEAPDLATAQQALAQGRVMLVMEIPPDFTRDLIRGERPQLRFDVDASDAVAINAALGALPGLISAVQQKNLHGSLGPLKVGNAPAFDITVHRLYNPEANTQFNVVPGLIGVILTMTMVMMTGLAITRERERGTMENLLATPVQPLEVTSGKIVPYVAIGMAQVSIIMLVAHFLFGVPIAGSVLTLYVVALLFVAASLSVGIMLSSFAQNQLQGVQLSVFWFLPNMLLSGFMFPFAGMPGWAQGIGSVLPLTYFNRAVRAIMLKGVGWSDLWPHIWPMMIFTVVVLFIAVRVYRKTLD